MAPRLALDPIPEDVEFSHGTVRLNWRPDPWKYDKPVVIFPSNKRQPRRVDYREFCPPVYNQGKLGSCSANAVAGAFEFDSMKQHLEVFTPSRLFIYYNERVLTGGLDKYRDEGATLTESVETMNRTGVIPETEWPYDISKFTVKPPAQCYIHAKQHRVIKSARVGNSLAQKKAALAQGYPIIFGFVVFESFRDITHNGIMSMPREGEKIIGGHAVMAVGYDERRKWFIVRNSWGNSWGDNGYFYMPYEFIQNHNYASDFWAVRQVVEKKGK